MRTILFGAFLALAGFSASALAAPDTRTPAKVLFGKVKQPSDQKAQAVGFYSKGCLAGAVALPIDGPAWQAMRLSRNRNWGMPRLVAYIEKLATDARKLDTWPGFLVGDMSQPRGGPMASGHASHQVGLDVDIWFDPMPPRTLTKDEREKKGASSLIVAKTHFDLDPAKWPAGLEKALKRAASYPEVERIFVNPGIKKRLCDWAGKDRAWLRKVRPYYSHHDHFHVRLFCPPGMAGCLAQKPTADDDGCSRDLDYWLSGAPWKPPPKPLKPVKPPPPLTLAGLPKACTDVLYSRDRPPESE